MIVRDLSCVVSNYRSTQSLDEYLKEQVSCIAEDAGKMGTCQSGSVWRPEQAAVSCTVHSVQMPQ